MMKVVLKLEINEDRIKQKAMKAVSGLSGVESVSEILSVGPAKEEKKDEAKKKEDAKKDPAKENVVINPFMFYGTQGYYNHQMKQQYNPYYGAVSVEEDPNSCVII